VGAVYAVVFLLRLWSAECLCLPQAKGILPLTIFPLLVLWWISVVSRWLLSASCTILRWGMAGHGAVQDKVQVSLAKGVSYWCWVVGCLPGVVAPWGSFPAGSLFPIRSQKIWSRSRIGLSRVHVSALMQLFLWRVCSVCVLARRDLLHV
jgi:hypothetical protein